MRGSRGLSVWLSQGVNPRVCLPGRLLAAHPYAQALCSLSDPVSSCRSLTITPSFAPFNSFKLV